MDWIELTIYFTLMVLLAKPTGRYLYAVLNANETTPLDRWLKPVEIKLYQWSGIDPENEQDWKAYLFSVLGFSTISALFISTLLALQFYLPLNSQKFPAPSWHLNLNNLNNGFFRVGSAHH